MAADHCSHQRGGDDLPTSTETAQLSPRLGKKSPKNPRNPQFERLVARIARHCASLLSSIDVLDDLASSGDHLDAGWNVVVGSAVMEVVRSTAILSNVPKIELRLLTRSSPGPGQINITQNFLIVGYRYPDFGRSTERGPHTVEMRNHAPFVSGRWPGLVGHDTSIQISRHQTSIGPQQEDHTVEMRSHAPFFSGRWPGARCSGA